MRFYAIDDKFFRNPVIVGWRDESRIVECMFVLCLELCASIFIRIEAQIGFEPNEYGVFGDVVEERFCFFVERGHNRLNAPIQNALIDGIASLFEDFRGHIELIGPSAEVFDGVLYAFVVEEDFCRRYDDGIGAISPRFLRFGIEFADGVDFVAEAFDADGMGMGGRPEIDDAPVNGKSARRIDFGGFDVSGPQESRLEIGDIEAIVAS